MQPVADSRRSGKKSGRKSGRKGSGTKTKSGKTSKAIAYTPSEIITHRNKKDGKGEFLVEWKDYPSQDDFTWESYGNLHGKKEDSDRKLLKKFLKLKDKLESELNQMDDTQMKRLLNNMKSRFTVSSAKKTKKGHQITVTDAYTNTKEIIHYVVGDDHIKIDTPRYITRKYIFARAYLAFKNLNKSIKETTHGMGECTRKHCLSSLIFMVEEYV